MSPFEAGKAAYLAQTVNPYICGTTKLGNPKFSDAEAGTEWEQGYLSAKPARVASLQEVQTAETVNVSRFRRKANRHYG